MVQRNNTELPPGFRFHPTDEELIMFYLRNQATSTPCPVSIIPEVDIYKFDPWELPEKAVSGENEWYFFTPRDRKYPNGVRPNRTAVSGYWKATGTDKIIYSGTEYVGVKKALVFYKGKPPKGVKTDWIMHEYRLNDPKRLISHKQNGSMRLDDWVLCRIYKKKNNKLGRGSEQKAEDSGAQTGTSNDASNLQMLRTCSLSNLWELDRLGSLSQLLNDNSYNNNPNFDHQNNNPNSDHQNTTGDAGNGSSGGIEKNHLGGLPYQYMDSVKFQANHSSAMMNQPIFGNPMFQFQ